MGPSIAAFNLGCSTVGLAIFGFFGALSTSTTCCHRGGVLGGGFSLGVIELLSNSAGTSLWCMPALFDRRSSCIVVNLQSTELEEQLKELTFDLIICFNPDDSELFQKTQLL